MKFGQYEIGDTLQAVGAFETKRAEGPEGTVILKLLRSDAVSNSHANMLQNEFDLLQSIDHPGVAHARDLIWDDGRPGLVMTDTGGRPLADVLIAEKRLPVDVALRLGIGVVLGLEALHDADIMHGDVTPRNLMVSDDMQTVTVIDLGLGQRRGLHLDGPQGLRGTPDYIAPELTGRAGRGADQRADFYSLGITLFEAIAGERPFVGGDLQQTIYAHIAQAPRSLASFVPTVPPVVEGLIARLLEKRPEARYQTAAGLLHDLRGALAQVQGDGPSEPFQLGTRDVPSRFMLSNVLHGRLAETAHLRQQFDEVRRGSGGGRRVEVAGFAGMGKSAVIEAVLPQADASGALCALGRIQPGEGSDPLGALAMAAQQLCELLLTGRYGEVPDWRARLESYVGDNLDVLLGLVPGVGPLTDRSTDVAPLPPREQATRLAIGFLSFFRACGSGAAPLLLVIEDVQWAGPALQEIMDSLVRGDGNERLMLLQSRRLEAGVDPADQPGHTDDRLVIGPLNEAHVADLLATTFHAAAEDLSDLAAAVLRKAGGTPLAIRQFIGALVDDGAIWFDAEQGKWCWDIETVRARDAGEDVLDVLLSRGARLSQEERFVLGVAALIDREVTPRAVAAGADVPAKHVAMVLERVSAMDWVAPLGLDLLRTETLDHDQGGDGRLRFTHERIWRAALDMLDAAERPAVHGRLSQFFEQGTPPDLFAAARHAAAALTGDSAPPETARARGLNAAAGGQAMAIGDRESAHRHFEAAVHLLDDRAYETSPQEALGLTAGAAGAALLAGSFPAMERHVDTFFGHCTDPVGRAPVHGMQVYALMAQGRMPDALVAGLAALEELGDPLPSQPTPDHIGAEVGGLFGVLAGRPVSDLIDLPMCDVPHQEAVQEINRAVSFPSFSANPMLFAASVVRLSARAIADGLTPSAVPGFTDMGLVACGPMNEIDLGYAFGTLSQALCDRPGLGLHRARVDTVFNAFIRHRKEPLRNCLPALAEAAREGLESGDIHSAALAIFDRAFNVFWIGERNSDAIAAFEEAASLCADVQVGIMPDLIALYRQLIEALGDAPNAPSVLSGRFVDGPELLAVYRARHDPNGQSQMHIAQMMQAHLFGSRDIALVEGRAAAGHLQGITSTPAVPAFYAMFAMIAVPAAGGASVDPADLAILEEGAALCALWAEHCAENYSHHAAILEAELALAKGEDVKWFERLDFAVEQATAQGFTRDAALALERIAEVSAARGRQGRYSHYIQEAWKAWVHYGATARTDWLMEHHRDALRSYLSRSGSLGVQLSQSITTEDLDLDSLLKATRLISQEVTLSNLVRALLTGLVETAGADRAIVAAPDGAGFTLLAELQAGAEGPEFTVSPDAVGSHALSPDTAPFSALHYVARTRETLATGDAPRNPRLAGDSYITARQPRSVAALPLLRGAELIGIVCLENSSIDDAFSPARMGVIAALCAQAAISWDNARLYERQSNLLDASDRFVPAELFRLIKRDSITNVQRGDCVERQMTIFVADLRASTTLAEQLGPEATFGQVNRFLSHASEVMHAHNGLVVKFVGDGVLALFPNDPADALAAAADLQHRLRASQMESGAPLAAGVVVHWGEVMLGAVGDGKRLQIDAMSDAINTAFRLEEQSKGLGTGVIVSDAVLPELSPESRESLRHLGDLTIRGRDQRETVYELINADAEEVAQRKRATRQLFEEAVRTMQRRDYDTALRLFQDVLSANPADVAAGRLYRHAIRFAARDDTSPVELAWGG